MTGVMVLQKAAGEGPGRLASHLSQRGIAVHVVRTDLGERPTCQIPECAGLIVMGGPMGVSDAAVLPYLREEMRLIEAALAASLPIVGICLGAQLLATVLGARVTRGKVKELGWLEVSLRPEAARDTLFRGLPSTFTPFHWHGDVFELPTGAVSLATSEATDHQAFRYGNRVYGLLFHLEVTDRKVRQMVSAFDFELRQEGRAPDPILLEAPMRLQQLEPIAAMVFDRWTDICMAGRAP